jgi:hypothetical protein
MGEYANSTAGAHHIQFDPYKYGSGLDAKILYSTVWFNVTTIAVKH